MEVIYLYIYIYTSPAIGNIFGIDHFGWFYESIGNFEAEKLLICSSEDGVRQFFHAGHGNFHGWHFEKKMTCLAKYPLTKKKNGNFQLVTWSSCNMFWSLRCRNTSYVQQKGRHRYMFCLKILKSSCTSRRFETGTRDVGLPTEPTTLRFNKAWILPIGSTGLVYLPIWMVDFYSKCW